MLTRKALNRNPGVCTRFTDRFAYLHLSAFCAQACLHTMHAVSKPLIKEKPIEPPNRFTIADAGYAWLTLLPDAGPYAYTGIIDSKGRVCQVYADLILDRGEGWFLDAYADVILFDDRRVLADDLDELENACLSGELSPLQAEYLKEQALLLKKKMLQDPEKWFSLMQEALTHFEGGNTHA